MTGAQWRQAWEIFQAARGVSEAERAAFVAARTDDAALVDRVLSLFAELDAGEPLPAPPLERQAGDRVGRYEIERRIGRGSYGEVWAGRDTELDRCVALKFLTPERQADEAAARRALREARAAAALNHPHIVVVHEVIAAEAGPVIVMELVDGAPLRSLLGRPLPPEQARKIAWQILKALAFAHAAGVVHRDLKPENIVVRLDGFVKVLDFGLARPVVPAPDQSASAGVSFGTLRYMAPEQCQGQPATPASDVFAAGLIVHEMLTGAHPFDAASWIATVQAIVHRDAPPARGPWEALVARMLLKQPAARPSAEEAAAAFEGETHVRPGRRWALGAAAAGAATLVGWGWLGRRSLVEPNARLTDTRLDPGDGVIIDERSFALSPDGRKLVFHGSRAKPSSEGGGPAKLHVLDLARGAAEELTGFDGQHAFWSPDGRELAYFANGKLWRQGYPTGPAREICAAENGSAGHWGANGIIVFASASYQPVSRVDANGGRPVVVTPYEPGAKRHEAPFLLPDGRHLIYWSAENRRIGRLMLADLEGREAPRVLAETSSSAIFLPRPGTSGGALVYRAKGALMALPFDADRNRVTGPVRMLAPRTSSINHHVVPATASARGELIYREMEDRRIQVKIFDRQGQLREKIAEPKEYIAARPSPDFRRLAMVSENRVTAQRDLDIYDFQTRQTITVQEAVASSDPTWSPDGKFLLAGNSSVSGGRELYRIAVEEKAAPKVELLPGPPFSSWPSDWTADGRQALVSVSHPATDFDIWLLPLEGGAKPRPVIAAPGRQQRASLSPDGQLLLYMSDETKTPEIWVTPFPPDGRQWKISPAGGQEPSWRGDGKEIFYQSMDFALMSVAVTGAPGQPSFAAPRRLFGGRSAEPALMVWHCEPSADGQRFVILTGSIQPAAAPLRLLQNWWVEGL